MLLQQQFRDLRISSSFKPEAPLDADDLSENYDEDDFYNDFDDHKARQVPILPMDKELDGEDEKEEGKENAKMMIEEQNFFGLDHLRTQQPP